MLSTPQPLQAPRSPPWHPATLPPATLPWAPSPSQLPALSAGSAGGGCAFSSLGFCKGVCGTGVYPHWE